MDLFSGRKMKHIRTRMRCSIQNTRQRKSLVLLTVSDWWLRPDSIRRLVKQLIFRLNQQQFRNNKYKKKDPTSEQTNTSRGASLENPIDLDDTSVDEKPHVAQHTQPRSRQTAHAGQSPTLARSHIVKLSVPSNKIASLGTRASDAIESHQDEASASSRKMGGTERSSTPPRRTDREDFDIYNIPPSPEPSGQAVRMTSISDTA
jgi:hypothetical protein